MSTNLETRIQIDAPPERVWAVLSDLGSFTEWCEDVRFPGASSPAEGARVPMRVRLFGVRLPVTVRFERVEAGRELCWRGGPRGWFEGAHYFRLAPGGAGGTELRHGEEFAGRALPLLFPLLVGELLAFYVRINDALKGRAESPRL